VIEIDLDKEFKSYGYISMLKKTNPKTFYEAESRYIFYLYAKLKMSKSDILKIYPTTSYRIHDAVISIDPKQIRKMKDSIRLAIGKKIAAWANPASGYNNYGKGGNVNSRHKLKVEVSNG
jgi:hypothetical protein